LTCIYLNDLSFDVQFFGKTMGMSLGHVIRACHSGLSF
jgi:hypothetical protein